MENPPGHAWDPGNDAPIKLEYDPEPYNTVEINRDWRASQASRCFSSDETEEEIRPYRKQNVGIQDNVDSNQLARTRVENRKLLKDTPHRDIKQENDDYSPQQRNYQEPPQQRMDPLRNVPNNNTFVPQEHPSNYYLPKGAPRENTSREFNPG